MDPRSAVSRLAGDPTLGHGCRSKDHVAEFPATPLFELTCSSHRNIKMTATFTTECCVQHSVVHAKAPFRCSFRVRFALMNNARQGHAQNEHFYRPYRLRQGLDCGPAAGCTMIPTETGGGSTLESRPELGTILDFIHPNETLVVRRIDRLARSLRDLQVIVERIRERGAHLAATEQPADTSCAAGKAFFDMLEVFVANARPKESPWPNDGASARADVRRSTWKRSGGDLPKASRRPEYREKRRSRAKPCTRQNATLKSATRQIRVCQNSRTGSPHPVFTEPAVCSFRVLSDVHICSHDPFRPAAAAPVPFPRRQARSRCRRDRVRRGARRS